MEFGAVRLNLEKKGHRVGDVYVQYEPDGTAPQFVAVDGILMPIMMAAELARGAVTLAQIAAHMGQLSV